MPYAKITTDFQKHVKKLSKRHRTPLELRVQAAKVGLTRYNTGQPCANGHMADRKVSSGVCCQCKKLQSQRRIENMRGRNREAFLAKQSFA